MLRYDHDSELMLSVVLAKMIPDGLGMLGGVSPPGPFDDANNLWTVTIGCRASNQALLLHPSLATTGPFCFVDATDRGPQLHASERVARRSVWC